MSKGLTWPDAVERRYFAGFPGEYGPGVVVPLAEIGLTEAQAQKRIKDGSLPLKVVEIEKNTKDKTEKGGE